MIGHTVIDALGARVRTEPTLPLLTYYDDATGERTELSAVTLANWVAKTANLLVDGLGLGRGATAVVQLPAHWQSAGVLLGCWSAGLTVDLNAAAPADVAFIGPAVEVIPPADETFALALAPMGMPFRPGPPLGTLDYAVEVRGHGDHFAGPVPSGTDPALADGTSHAALVAAVASLAVPAGGRVLIDADATTDPVSWLVAPLVAGSSIVLCHRVDAAGRTARLASERATAYP